MKAVVSTVIMIFPRWLRRLLGWKKQDSRFEQYRYSTISVAVPGIRCLFDPGIRDG
jgi:hypothetical protein